MDNKKSQIRDEIQRSFKKYQLRLKKDVETYSQELKDTESIYEKSRELVDNLLLAKDEGEQEKIEIKMEALKILLEENFQEEEEDDLTNMFYPEVGDKEFGYKTYHKREFHQYQIPKQTGNAKQLDKLMTEKCSKGVKTSDTQKLLKNFLSPHTPYRGLLVYHGVGVGKTCASIMIAENYKKELADKNKKIFIILPPSIEENYRRQIIDISKISRSPNDIRKQCTGDNYMTDKFIKKLKTLKTKDGKYDMNEIQRLADKIINKHYEFMGYEKFVNKISAIELSVLKKNPETKKKKGAELQKIRRELVNKRIRDEFSDSLMIIDEAHNITSKDEAFKKGKGMAREESVEVSLSDSILDEEKVNNNLEGGSKSNINNLIKDMESNEELDSWTMDDSDSDTTKASDNLSTISQHEIQNEKLGKQFPPTIKKVLKTAENIKLVLLTATPMFNTAEEIVDLINLLLINDRRPIINVRDIFKDGELTKKGKEVFISKISGYISYLRGENPINFPQKLDPLPEDGLYQKPYPKYDVNGDKLNSKIDFLKIVDCEMSSLQWQVYQNYFNNRREEGNYFDTIGLQVCNLVCSDKIDTKKDDISFISNYYGTRGFENIIDVDSKKNNFQLSFKTDSIQEMFTLDKLHHISSKLKKLIEGIERSKGICFIYSQFLWSGIYPLALALELLGYSNYSGKNLLPNKYKIPKKKVKVVDNLTGNVVERNMKYLIIKGGSSEDFENYKKKDEINNMDGSLLKLVLGTKAAGEGLNIYHVREVHVMEPWFHLNRLEQIIGRGIRNCSHTNLPAEDRNVSVFLYCVTEPKNLNRPIRETLDMKLYRVAEEKIGKVGKVMEIIKSSSIDCHLNREGNVFTGSQWNTPIKMIDSRGNSRNVIVEDKKFSNVCNYSKTCDIKCYPTTKKLKEDKINNTTYKKEFSEDNIKNCMEEISNLFSLHEFNIVFTLKEIKKFLATRISNITDDVVYQSLHLFVKENVPIYDHKGNEGSIIYRGSKEGEKYYIFQPLQTSEELPVILRKLRYDTKIKKIRLEKLVSKKDAVSIVVEEKDDLKIFNRFMKRFEGDINKSPNANIITIVSNNLEELKNIKCPKNSAKCIHNLLVEKYFDYYSKNDRESIIELVIKTMVRHLDLNKIEKTIKPIHKIDFFENDKLETNELINQTVETINFLDKDNNVRKAYVRGLVRYIITNHLEYNRDSHPKLDENYLGYSYGLEDKLVFCSYLEGEFLPADKKTVSYLATYKDRRRVNMDDYHDIYGFCEMQSKTQKHLKFKIVEKTKEKGTKKTQEVTGSTCGPAYDLEGHINILKKLDQTDTTEKINQKSEKLGKKTDACEGIEILLRMLNYFKQKSYFFNYEDCLVWKNQY